jgi:protein ImuA
MNESLFSKSSIEGGADAWRPGLHDDATPHGEIFAFSREAAGAAVALALALDRITSARPDALAPVEDRRPWLWVQDSASARLTGLPYPSGLPSMLSHRLIHVAAKRPEDALFALEEGLRCRDLSFVIGEIAGNPKALDFIASRRLTLAAEKSGVPLWLIRLNARRDLSSARMRWEVRSAASPHPRWNPEAPGIPSWRAELFRARNHPYGEWILRDDANGLTTARADFQPALCPADSGNLAAAIGDRSLAAR